MAKNSLRDLNDHLFMAMERLNEEDLTAEDIEREAARAEAMVKVADQITENAKTQLAAAKLFAEHGSHVLDMLPQVSSGGPSRAKLIEGKPAGEAA